MYAAIDELAHKLDRAIIKHKEKTLTHRHDSVSLKSESIE
jgi:ribosome-associated translation inhibitor RaiA